MCLMQEDVRGCKRICYTSQPSRLCVHHHEQMKLISDDELIVCFCLISCTGFYWCPVLSFRFSLPYPFSHLYRHESFARHEIVVFLRLEFCVEGVSLFLVVAAEQVEGI